MSERHQALAMAGAELFLAAAWAIDVFLNPFSQPSWMTVVGLLGIAILVIAAVKQIAR